MYYNKPNQETFRVTTVGGALLGTFNCAISRAVRKIRRSILDVAGV